MSKRRATPTPGLFFRGSVRHAKPMFAPRFNDNHPDNLRMWREHAPDHLCPDGWYAVRVGPEGLGGWAVYLCVEMDPDDVRSLITVDQELRTLWWTPSEELAREMVRQLKNHERRMFSPYRVEPAGGRWEDMFKSAGGEIFRPLGNPADTERPPGTDTFRVSVEMFQRRGSVASPTLTAASILVSGRNAL